MSSQTHAGATAGAKDTGKKKEWVSVATIRMVDVKRKKKSRPLVLRVDSHVKSEVDVFVVYHQRGDPSSKLFIRLRLKKSHVYRRIRD